MDTNDPEARTAYSEGGLLMRAATADRMLIQSIADFLTSGRLHMHPQE